MHDDGAHVLVIARAFQTTIRDSLQSCANSLASEQWSELKQIVSGVLGDILSLSEVHRHYAAPLPREPIHRANTSWCLGLLQKMQEGVRLPAANLKPPDPQPSRYAPALSMKQIVLSCAPPSVPHLPAALILKDFEAVEKRKEDAVDIPVAHADPPPALSERHRLALFAFTYHLSPCLQHLGQLDSAGLHTLLRSVSAKPFYRLSTGLLDRIRDQGLTARQLLDPSAHLSPEDRTALSCILTYLDGQPLGVSFQPWNLIFQAASKTTRTCTPEGDFLFYLQDAVEQLVPLPPLTTVYRVAMLPQHGNPYTIGSCLRWAVPTSAMLSPAVACTCLETHLTLRPNCTVALFVIRAQQAYSLSTFSSTPHLDEVYIPAHACMRVKASRLAGGLHIIELAHMCREEMVAEHMLNNAPLYLAAGKRPLAMQQLRKIHHLFPDTVSGMLAMATVRTVENPPDNYVASKYLVHALELEPDNPVLLSRYAELLGAGGDYLNAEVQYRRALHLNPYLYSATGGLVKIYAHRADQRAAREISPQFSLSRYRTGRRAMSNGDWEGACAALYDALCANPHHETVLRDYLIALESNEEETRAQAFRKRGALAQLALDYRDNSDNVVMQLWAETWGYNSLVEADVTVNIPVVENTWRSTTTTDTEEDSASSPLTKKESDEMFAESGLSLRPVSRHELLSSKSLRPGTYPTGGPAVLPFSTHAKKWLTLSPAKLKDGVDANSPTKIPTSYVQSTYRPNDSAPD